jgi:hypothetical protein
MGDSDIGDFHGRTLWQSDAATICLRQAHRATAIFSIHYDLRTFRQAPATPTISATTSPHRQMSRKPPYRNRRKSSRNTALTAALSPQDTIVTSLLVSYSTISN